MNFLKTYTCMHVLFLIVLLSFYIMMEREVFGLLYVGSLQSNHFCQLSLNLRVLFLFSFNDQFFDN